MRKCEKVVKNIFLMAFFRMQPTQSKCCLEAKFLSRRQPAFKIFSLLFLFLILESNELHLSNMVYYSILLVITVLSINYIE